MGANTTVEEVWEPEFGEMRLAVTVTCDDLSSEASINETFTCLIKGCDFIYKAREDGESEGPCSISVEAPNAKVQQLAVNLPANFKPWQTRGLTFWDTAARNPLFHEQITTYIGALEKIVTDFGTELFEQYGIPFGEPTVTMLGSLKAEFVPFYTRLLSNWDLEHQYEPLSGVNFLVSGHGLCAETEKLLFTRIFENHGPHGPEEIEELLPFLDQETGGLADSSLFQQMVKRWVPDPSDTQSRQSILDFLDEQWQGAPGLKSAAERILTLN